MKTKLLLKEIKKKVKHAVATSKELIQAKELLRTKDQVFFRDQDLINELQLKLRAERTYINATSTTKSNVDSDYEEKDIKVEMLRASVTILEQDLASANEDLRSMRAIQV